MKTNYKKQKEIHYEFPKLDHIDKLKIQLYCETFMLEFKYDVHKCTALIIEHAEPKNKVYYIRKYRGDLWAESYDGSFIDLGDKSINKRLKIYEQINVEKIKNNVKQHDFFALIQSFFTSKQQRPLSLLERIKIYERSLKEGEAHNINSYE